MKVTADVSCLFGLAFTLTVLSCTGVIGDRPAEGDPDPSGAAAGGTGPQRVDPTWAKLAPASVARRLSVREYNNVIRALTYDTSSLFSFAEARTPFDNDGAVADNAIQVPAASLIDNTESTAADAALRLMVDKSRLQKLMGSIKGCPPSPTAGDGACFERFLRVFGRRALRRPLDDAEVAAFVDPRRGIFKYAQEDNNFTTAVALAVRTFLQHPELVYHIEADTRRPVPGQPGFFQLNGWEMASRLSFLLWGEGPDDELLDGAADGSLDGAGGIRRAAVRMFQDARARNTVAALHAMWLNYETLLGVPATLAEPMRTQTRALIEKVVFVDQDPWVNLLLADKTYVNYDLASHYRITIPPGSAVKQRTTGFEWLGWGSGRVGLLSEGSFLSLAATQDEELMVIRRGKYINERLLCQALPPKPAAAGSNATPAGPCKGQVMAAHRSDGGCAACHARMDPIGFGLDGYDGSGKPRTHDKVDDFIHSKFPGLKVGDALNKCPGPSCCPVQSQGQLDPADPQSKFIGPGGLARLVAATAGLDRCLVRQVYRFAVGRSELDDIDSQFVDSLLGESGQERVKLTDLLLGLVTSDGYRSRRQTN